MAGQEWDWFQREELIGHISDIRVQNLQVVPDQEESKMPVTGKCLLS